MSYPTTSPSYTTPDATKTLAEDHHTDRHTQEEADIVALSEKVGIGASTPTNVGDVLTVTGAAESEWQAPVDQTPDDATTTIRGIVKLAGDLGGTADLPTVPGLAAKADDADVVHDTGNETIAGVKTFSSSPVVPAPSSGTDTANKDYVDGVASSGTPDATSSVKGKLQLTGDLGGTAASPTVPGLTSKANDSAVVHNTGNETVAGIKTFSSSPIVPTPTTSTQAATKGYVDGLTLGSNAFVMGETPTGSVNGSNTSFTVLQSSYIANSLTITVNGIFQARTADYTETTPGSGIFTFTTAPLTGDVVRTSYQYTTGASGNADTVDGFHASSTAAASRLLPLDSNATFPQSVIQTGLLGYSEITSIQTSTDTSGNGTSIGLGVTVTVPTLPTGRRVKITVHSPAVYNNTLNQFARLVLWQGVIASGTQLRFTQNKMAAATIDSAITMVHFTPANPTPGSYTFNVALSAVGGGTASVYAAGPTGAAPANGTTYIAVEVA